jgi:tetratricopeptide (TPR) repeat protein
MSGKNRKKKTISGGKLNSKNNSPAQVLAAFKSLWLKEDWLQALSAYRSWLNRTGNTGDPSIEAELLLHCADDRWRAQKPEQALNFLEEMRKKYPADLRPDLYKGIILARTNKLNDALAVFRSLGDEFHATVVETLIARNEALPQEPPAGPRFPAAEMLKAWQGAVGGREVAPAESALKNLVGAYAKHTAGEDPEPELALLSKKSGCEFLSDFLLLVSAVARRRKIKIRHLMADNPLFIREGNVADLSAGYLGALVRERDFKEFFLVLSLLGPAAARLPAVVRARDQAHFSCALQELADHQFKAALEHFQNITHTTVPVLHNTALCLQKLEQYREANTCWTHMLQAEGKPKGTDPADVRMAYAQTCRYIGHNYLRINEFSEAYPYFKTAFVYHEDDKENLYDLGNVCAELDRHQEAFRYAKRLFELDPRDEINLFLYTEEAAKNNVSEEIIPVLETFHKQSPDYPPCRYALARAHLDVMWRSWTGKTSGIFELDSKMKKLKTLTAEAPFPKLLYLEAVLLNASGNIKASHAKIDRAFEATQEHFEEYELASALYDDGMKKESLGRIMKIASCDCDVSDHLTERAVEFLISRDDVVNARRVADFAVDVEGYPPGLAAEIFLDAGRPEEALRYSLRAVRQAGADLDDYYLHLFILNALGEKEATLAFAIDFLESARKEGDERDVLTLTNIIKEIKSRGRFKI